MCGFSSASPEVWRRIKERVEIRDVPGKDNFLLVSVIKPIAIVALKKPLPLLLDMQQVWRVFFLFVTIVQKKKQCSNG